MDTQSRLGYMPALDGLRAVAIVLVVASHATPQLTYGRVGVDVFFVLSGFLITTLIADPMRSGAFSRRRFYARRAIRLVPALLVGVIVLTPAALFVMDDPGKVWWGAFAALLYLAPIGPVTIFFHTWTLAFEEWFYLLWPLALGRMFRDRLTARQAMILVAVVALTLQVAMAAAPGFYFFRVSGLLLGCALALWWIDGGRISRPSPTLALGICMILVGGGWMSPADHAAIPLLLGGWGAVLVIAALVSGAAGVLRSGLELGPVVAVGVVSYEWYLLHAPMMRMAHEWGDGSRWAVVPVSLVLAFGLHRLCVPIQARLRRGGTTPVNHQDGSAMIRQATA
ncbi:acyltransferase family protein [Aeromicrobium sp.]|uniref:acyltransferase family protein n=1 Tax=Aeromicrobium sp. TaxID=1871063 RepID=UPI002FC68CC7